MLTIGMILLLLAVLLVQILSWRKIASGGVDLAPLLARTEAIERAQERTERGLREEIGRNRDEAAREARDGRQEVQTALATFNTGLRGEIAEMAAAQRSQLELFGGQLSDLNRATDEKLGTLRDALESRLAASAAESLARLDRMRTELVSATQQMRAEVAENLKGFNDSLVNSLALVTANQSAAMARLSETTAQSLETVRGAVQERLKSLQDENALKLEQIRTTVDEQLQSTLEKRLGESFKIVSDRLEQVHRGLGEMQSLAAGVGDLKKLLSNVRTRGTWGEVQLGLLLEQILTVEQYGTNVATTGSAERVEFAIKLPGGEPDRCVWLPIDAKFPKEDYERLVDAVERADAAAIDECSRQLEIRARQCARDISQKYLAPPATTDFAIMYLPTEGLYAEVLRRPGLIEMLQREHRVTVAGPMTLAAILNSLQMGFRTLAIQKRSSEVWEVLGKVKTEFGRYADVLTKVQKKLQEASNTVDAGLTRTRVIQSKLKNVQEIPAGDAGIPLPMVLEELEPEAVGAAAADD